MSYVDTSIIIGSELDMHRHLLSWMAGDSFGKEVRTLQLIQSHSPEVEEGTNDPHTEAHVMSEPLHYSPAVGQYTYVFEGHRLTIERTIWPGSKDKDDVDSIKISCLSPFAGARVVKAFLEHVKRAVAVKMVNQTYVYKVDDRARIWQGHARPSRNLNAVTLDRRVKDSLVQDIGAYLSPKTRRYYSNRGIPWRRGFLFYGPPGTGKTSFTTALAGHFNLHVFVLSLSSSVWDDVKLENLLMQLPSRCILLIEDIDSAGIQREQMTAPTTPSSKSDRSLSRVRAPAKPQDDMPQAGITLSGLLNAIDGMHSVEGRILIMTSNNPDSLDEALVRRGRIDRSVLFGYATRDVSAELFEHVFVKSADELLEDEVPRDREEIAQMARQFADSFPPNVLTPADVQGFLLDHRTDPAAAVNGIGAYGMGVLQKRAMGTIVESFADGKGGGAGLGAALRSATGSLLQLPFKFGLE